MRVGPQQGAVTRDVDRRTARSRRRSMRHHPFGGTSSTMKSGGVAMMAIVTGFGLALGAFAGDQVIDRSVDDDTTLYTAGRMVPSPFIPGDPSAVFGSALLPIDQGLVVIGAEGVSGATATVLLVPDDGPATPAEVVFAERTVTAAGDTLVVVDTRRLRITSIGDDGSLTEFANYPRNDEADFANVAALGGSTLAVLREPTDGRSAIVEVFDVTDVVTPVVAFAPELDRVAIAVDPTGDLIAISGVRGQSDVGEVQFFRRSGEAWLVDARFEAIGGGPIVASSTSPASFHVQRNGFFARPTGTWTGISADADGVLALSREWSVQASSLAVSDGLVAFGRPNDERVMTFTLTESVHEAAAGAGLRHAQTISAPVPPADDGGPVMRVPPESRFGTSVAFVGNRLVVAGPGAEIDGVDDEGAIFVFEATIGPAGCTITGTDGDDTLNGTTGDDTICGLGGDDLIRGNLGFDRIYGGPGDDDLSGDGDDDLLVGGDGNDRLAGGAGDDRLLGGSGNDTLFGGAGDDHLDGGDGRDACDGGADLDTFANC